MKKFGAICLTLAFGLAIGGCNDKAHELQVACLEGGGSRVECGYLNPKTPPPILDYSWVEDGSWIEESYLEEEESLFFYRGMVSR